MSSRSYCCQKPVLFQLYLLERTRVYGADLLSLVNFDASGRIHSVNFVNPSSLLRRECQTVDPQSLLFALMTAGHDAEELSEQLVIWTEHYPNQVEIGSATSSSPWEFKDATTVVHLWPTVVALSRGVQGRKSPLSKPNTAPVDSIDDALNRLRESGFTQTWVLLPFIKQAPRLVLDYIGWLLSHPYINTRVGREALHTIFTGGCRLCDSNSYRDGVAGGLEMMLQWHFHREDFKDVKQIAFFCQLLRRVLSSHSFVAPRGQESFSIQPFNPTRRTHSPPSRRLTASGNQCLLDPEAVSRELVKLGFLQDHDRLHMLGTLSELSLEAMIWLLRQPLILTGRRQEALRIVFLGARERYYEHASWEKVAAATELLLNGPIPVQMKQHDQIFIEFLKIVIRALRHFDLKEVLYNQEKAQDC